MQVNDKTYETQTEFDLQITELENVHFSSTNNWARPTAFPRPSDGIVLFTGGVIEYDFGNEKITAKPGDLLLLPKGLVYSGERKSKESNDFYVVDFYTDKKLPFSALSLPKVFAPVHYDILKSQFEELLGVWQSGDLSAKIALKGKLYSLISDIIHQYLQYSLGNECFSKTQKIADYIEKMYCKNDLSVSEICERFYISVSTLRRIMISAYNKTPVRYLTDVRIKNAKNMLVYDNLSISEISERCGFSSPHYFSRIFKKEVGVTPLKYKNSK